MFLDCFYTADWRRCHDICSPKWEGSVLKQCSLLSSLLLRRVDKLLGNNLSPAMFSHILSPLMDNSRLAQKNCLYILYTCRPCHTCWWMWGKQTKIVIALPSILFVLLNSALYEGLTKEGSRMWYDHVIKPDRLNLGSLQDCGLEYVDIKSNSQSGLPHSTMPFQSNQSSENPIYLGKEKYRNRMSRA